MNNGKRDSLTQAGIFIGYLITAVVTLLAIGLMVLAAKFLVWALTLSWPM
jgi:hypothetical protein